MTNTINITRIPASRVPIVDKDTGLISREWYRFFYNVFVLTGTGENPVTLDELQLAPPSINFISDTSNGSSVAPANDALVAQIAELQKRVQAAELSPEAAVNLLQAQIVQLSKAVDGLQMTPPPREFKRSRYGSFYDTTSQAATIINTATAVTFNTTDLSQGVFRDAITSRIVVDQEGVYNFAISFQIDKTSGGVAAFYIWFRVNGVNVPNSASHIKIQGNNAEIFTSVNFFLDLKSNDYVEVMFSVGDLSVILLAEPATAPVPAIPSIILTVNNNIEGVL